MSKSQSGPPRTTSDKILPPSQWPGDIISILNALHTLSAPRTQDQLNNVFVSSPVHLDLSTIAARVLAVLHEAHYIMLDSGRSTRRARALAYRAIEGAIGRPTGLEEQTGRRWDESKTEIFVERLTELLRSKPRIWKDSVDVSSLPPSPSAAIQGTYPAALDSFVPFRRPAGADTAESANPPPRSSTLDDSLSQGLIELGLDDDECMKMEGEAELNGCVVAETEMVVEDDVREQEDKRYGAMWAPKSVFSWGHSTTPAMPIPQLETLPQWQSFLRTLLVRGYHFKNGISIETAERYADAIFECLGDFVNDEDKIKLIVASKYTTDPETALEKAGLLRKVFGEGNQWDEEESWAYIKFVRLNHRHVDDLALRSKNSFTRSRMSKISVVLSEKQGVTDPVARGILETAGVLQHGANPGVSVSQAGLFADVSKKRLDLERRELSEVESGACVKIRTWIEAVWTGNRGDTARYYGVIRYPLLASRLRVDLTTARLVAECGLFGLIEGPTNLNVIALGDMNKLGVDLKPMLDVLEMDASLKVAPEDQVTPALLHDAGYKGGSFDTFLLTHIPGAITFVALCDPFNLPVRRQPTRPGADSVGTTLAVETMLVLVDRSHPGVLRLVLVKSVNSCDTMRILLNSPIQGSAFVAAPTGVLRVRIVPHPFLHQHLAICAADQIQGSRVDWWVELGGSAGNEKIHGDTAVWGGVKVLTTSPEARKLLGWDAIVSTRTGRGGGQQLHVVREAQPQPSDPRQPLLLRLPEGEQSMLDLIEQNLDRLQLFGENVTLLQQLRAEEGTTGVVNLSPRSLRSLFTSMEDPQVVWNIVVLGIVQILNMRSDGA